MEIELRIFHGEFCSSYGKLREPPRASRTPDPHKVCRIEVSDLRSHPAGEERGVECADEVHGRLACDEGVPEGVLADAVGGDHPQAGDDYATGLSHHSLPDSSMAQRSMRRARRELKYHKYRKILRIAGRPRCGTITPDMGFRLTRRAFLAASLPLLASPRATLGAAPARQIFNYSVDVGVLFNLITFALKGTVVKEIDHTAGRYRVSMNGEGDSISLDTEARGMIRKGRFMPVEIRSNSTIRGRESRLDMLYDHDPRKRLPSRAAPATLPGRAGGRVGPPQRPYRHHQFFLLGAP